MAKKAMAKMDHAMMAHSVDHSTHLPPLPIMGGHTHSGKDWMLSYRYVRMNMHGNRNRNHRIDVQDVYNAGFTVAPLKMTADMHMLGAMYGVNDALTLAAMVNYQVKDMDLRTAGARIFPHHPAGLGIHS